MNLTLAELQDLVSERYLSRGENYFKEGLVELSFIDCHQVDANVIGTGLYRVTLQKITKNSQLKGLCSCPAYEEFGPCKHMAATGLAVIKQVNEGGYCPSRDYFDRAEVYKKFNQHLESKNKAELINFIIQLSNHCPEILDDYY